VVEASKQLPPGSGEHAVSNDMETQGHGEKVKYEMVFVLMTQ
jgi:hypothetical protein